MKWKKRLMLWNKSPIVWQDKKSLNIKCSWSFGLLSPSTVYCVSVLCIGQTSPISRNTCSAVIKSTILASARQLLKDNIPWEPEGSRDLPLCSCRPGLCELSRMSQKTRTRLARCGTVLRPFREALPRSKSSVWLKYNVVSFLDRLMNFFLSAVLI